MIDILLATYNGEAYIEEQITKRLLCLDAGINEKEIQNLNQKDIL